MSAITLDPYLPAASWLHRRDPRAKLGAVILLLLAVAFIPNGSWPAFGLWLVGALILARLGHVPPGLLLRRSLLALPFVLGALLLPFTVQGEPWARLPLVGWPISGAGVVRGATLVLRAWISVLLFALLTASTRIRDLLWALEALHVPSVVVAVIEFAFRYLALVVEEGASMLRARRARTVNWRGRGVPLRRQLSSTGGMLGTLILRGLDRSERVHASMLARGYDGVIRRVTRPQIGWLDRGLLGAGALVLLLAWLS